jgi:putative protein-disulfide isomerase
MKHLVYLYDPLCGWCYGSVPAMQALAAGGDWIAEPVPSGLFAGTPSRRIDAGFSKHIEQADARIASISGQLFSHTYRQQVLHNRELSFDSGPATEALCAVSRWSAPKELTALHALQLERFVHGRDITKRDVIANALAEALGDDIATWHERLAAPDLPVFTESRLNRARQLMQATGVHGVPTLLWAAPEGLRLLPGQWLFNGKPLADSLATLH